MSKLRYTELIQFGGEFSWNNCIKIQWSKDRANTSVTVSYIAANHKLYRT